MFLNPDLIDHIIEYIGIYPRKVRLEIEEQWDNKREQHTDDASYTLRIEPSSSGDGYRMIMKYDADGKICLINNLKPNFDTTRLELAITEAFKKTFKINKKLKTLGVKREMRRF